MNRHLRALSLTAIVTASCGREDVRADAAIDAARDVADASAAPEDQGPAVVARPDERPPCAARNPLRNVYFGDLHAHTRLSFDAITYDVRGGPAEAYAFARGEEVGIAPFDARGVATRRLRLARPLDFAAITDHAEYLAETTLCHDPRSSAYGSSTCVMYRDAMGLVSPISLGLSGLTPGRPPVCDDRDPTLCARTFARVWDEVQSAAEAAYDRTDACRFTTFVAYEWSGSPGGNNAHRNVIFRNRTVPVSPATYYDARTPELLWRSLRATCLDSGTGCDALAIPHNSNLGGGRMFLAVNDRGTPYTREEAALRARVEPLVEIYQHKGSSECLAGARDPLSGEDERCGFERLTTAPCRGTPDDPPGCTPVCGPNPIGAFTGACAHPRDFVRAALRTGLVEWSRVGVDPFHLGIIASTDTHAAIPGAVDEATWPGHTGSADADPARRLTAPIRGEPQVSVVTSSPGGLAAVWADENSRGAIFDALRRRETFGTSGPRITVRFFGGWTLARDSCARPDMVEMAYREGVPMGSDLRARPDGAAAPTFVLSALRDAMGQPLARIQIVKAWVVGSETRERVYDLATAGEGATVDLATCTPRGSGADTLCESWTDPDFDPASPALWYARVLETPTCRWSRRVCNELRVDCAAVGRDSPLRACCDGTVADTVQERAWTSPIWYLPAR